MDPGLTMSLQTLLENRDAGTWHLAHCKNFFLVTANAVDLHYVLSPSRFELARSVRRFLDSLQLLER